MKISRYGNDQLRHGLTSDQVLKMSILQEDLLPATAKVDFSTLLMGLESLIEARPDTDPNVLEAFGNRILARAWEMNRGG